MANMSIWSGLAGFFRGRWCGSGLHGHLATQHPAGNGAEFQLCEQLGEQVSVYLFHDECRFVKWHRHGKVDGGQPLGEERLLLEILHVLLQLAFQFGGAFVHRFHRPIFLNELDGGLLAHARNTGDVVHSISPHAEHINELGRVFQAIFLANLSRAHYLHTIAAARGLVHEYLVRYELAVVLVGRHHVGGVAVRFGPFGEGANHIIRLKTFQTYHRNAEALDEPFDVRDAGTEVIGHGLAVGLVGREFLLAQGGTGHVERHSDVGWFLLLEQVEQGDGEAKDSRGVQPFGIDHRLGTKGKEGTVDERKGIEQKEALVLGGVLLGHVGEDRISRK
jgi:hypothetical protein